MTTKFWILFLLLSSSIFVTPLLLAQPNEIPEHTKHNQTPEQYDSTLTWDELANLDVTVETPAPLQTIFHINFPQNLLARNGKTVKIRGYMYPLKAGETHDYFLFSALPPSCPFCLPGGQTSLIEIKSAERITYTLEPVLLQGQFAILEDDPSGLYYRMTEVRQVPD